MDGEVSNHSGLFEMSCKLLTCEFASSIHSQDLYAAFSLNVDPCLVLFVVAKGLRFFDRKVYLFFVSELVLEADGVIFSSQ